jgi:hypothetical protein
MNARLLKTYAIVLDCVYLQLALLRALVEMHSISIRSRILAAIARLALAVEPSFIRS